MVESALYLFGTKWKPVYNYFYVSMIIVASTIKLDIAINFMDSAFCAHGNSYDYFNFVVSSKSIRRKSKIFSRIIIH